MASCATEGLEISISLTDVAETERGAATVETLC